MKLPAPLQTPGVSQDMVATLREITAFRRNENPRQTQRAGADSDTRRPDDESKRSTR